jgi:hypothetical protein
VRIVRDHQKPDVRPVARDAREHARQDSLVVVVRASGNQDPAMFRPWLEGGNRADRRGAFEDSGVAGIPGHLYPLRLYAHMTPTLGVLFANRADEGQVASSSLKHRPAWET